MQKNKVYFRADGNDKIGLGHVIRSLALAEMLNETFECHFIIKNPLDTLKKQILGVCQSIIILSEENELKYMTKNLLKKDDIIVLDGYYFTTVYQQALKDKGCIVVCIDDIHAYHYVADAVINHAPNVHPSNYSIEPYTKLFLGLDYSLLRKPFLEATQKTKKTTDIKNVFVCFGGSDSINLTLKVLKAFIKNEIQVNQINVVLGAANILKKEIEAFANQITHPKIKLQSNLSAKQMCALMEESDLAIVPASSILFEVIAVKMLVISGYYIDNQINIYRGFKSLGLIYGIENFNQFEDYSSVLIDLMNNDHSKILHQQHKLQKISIKENYLNLFKKLQA